MSSSPTGPHSPARGPLPVPWLRFFSLHRLLVTLGVASTIGVVEWMGLGHPIGMVFGLLMGLGTLALAPLPWLWILPWGLRRPPLQILLRAAAVLALSGAMVVLAFVAFFWAREQVVGEARPILGVLPHLSAWSSMVISIPLFTAAGWGLARHLELERRLDVRDVRELALRDALEEARMLALQSRLDPHFLFNTLNLVAELCRDDPAEAERCVVRLSGLLRAALEHGRQPLIPLARELDLCADYLDLCRTRFGDRLELRLRRAPEAEQRARAPLFAVQVLCENAIRHGVERTPGPGLVEVRSAADDGQVRVTVTSPGPFRGERRGGVGLQLTRRRLRLAFHGAAALEVGSGPDGQRTVARLTLPAAAGDGQGEEA
jgi:hypothetical protein